MLKKHSIDYVDVGTSGGIWGLTEGYSMMVGGDRSEEHTSELQSHSFISYAVFCLKKKNFFVKTTSLLLHLLP